MTSRIIYHREGGFSVDLKRLLEVKRAEMKALLQRQHEALRLPQRRSGESS